MSFILDALRKSETERQRQSAPGLIDAGFRPPARQRTIWLPVLVAVLVANLLAMGVFLATRDPAPADAAAVQPPTPARAMPGTAGRNLAEAAGVSPVEQQYEAIADLPALEEGPVTEVLEPPSEGASTATASPQAETGPPSVIRDDLPSAAQLMASGAIPASDLHLDIHVYSTVPAERFVFVNMRKYGEGAELPQGARIEEITRDGVVLSQDGQRFVLTRD